MKSYTLTEETLNEVLQILGSLSYNQSAQAITKVQQELQAQAAPEPVTKSKK